MPESPVLIPVTEAARLLDLSKTSLYEELQSNRLRSLKVGSRRLIPRTAINQWIDDRLAESDAQ